jgi:hypothetical protein
MLRNVLHGSIGMATVPGLRIQIPCVMQLGFSPVCHRTLGFRMSASIQTAMYRSSGMPRRSFCSPSASLPAESYTTPGDLGRVESVEKKPSLLKRLRAFFTRTSSGSTTLSEESSSTSVAVSSVSDAVVSPSGRSRAVVGLSPLARYLYDKAHFSVVNRRVKERAFLPPPSLRLSVFVVENLDHDEIVELGRQVTERELRAYATLDVGVPEAQGLTVERDDNPFRHAEIGGWPAAKEHQKEIAQELASASVLHQV